jgi:hypothetical protein
MVATLLLFIFLYQQHQVLGDGEAMLNEAAKAAPPSTQGSLLGHRDSSSLLPMLPVPDWESYNYVAQPWSTKYHFFLCAVPKCGSTSWLELVYKMHLGEEQLNDLMKRGSTWMHGHLSFPEQGLMFRPHAPPRPGGGLVWEGDAGRLFKFSQEERLQEERTIDVLNNQTYFKFAVVRHPWNRLVSGYLQKYVSRCKKNRRCFHDKFSPQIDVNLLIPLTLTELLLALEHEPHHQINQHFRPTVEICDVGRIPYDFIADMENPAHIAYLLERIKSPYPLPKENVLHDQHVEPDDLLVACTRATVDLAARLYAKDLESYGYTMDAAYASCEKYGLAHPPKT